MYELSIAAKYLTPRWRQLSVSIISMISILVIAVVVWLIIVFFSVTNGLTEGWLDKLTALTSPVRVTPTKAYYDSYYHLVDSISSNSNYSLKTISEKLASANSDPYNAHVDQEIPTTWKAAEFDHNGTLIDPVKLAFGNIERLNFEGIGAAEYENHAGKLHLRLWRQDQKEIPNPKPYDPPQGYLAHASIFGSLDSQNPWLLKALLQPSMQDLSNLLSNLDWEGDGFEDVEVANPTTATQKAINDRLKNFFEHVHIEQLAASSAGWQIPPNLIPAHANWKVIALKKGNAITKLIVPPNETIAKQYHQLQKWQGYSLVPGILEINGSDYQLHLSEKSVQRLNKLPRLYLPAGVVFNATLKEDSLNHAQSSNDLLFDASITIQNTPLNGIVPYYNLDIAKAKTANRFTESPKATPFWLYAYSTSDQKLSLNLPSHPSLGEGVLLPRAFRDSGLLLGDSGHIAYFSASPTGMHEERIPIFIAGFYDPGIIPIGGKYVIANRNVLADMRAPSTPDEPLIGNGINVRFTHRQDADAVKAALETAFKRDGIADYWKIETYRDFQFTKDVIQQLQSDKHLFSLLATLIIIVACSNIISMLIILVNDKKNEIGILRSMGSSSLSIAIIFGSCGVFIGIVGSVAGTLAAMMTLKNLQPIVNFISWVQGYEMFNPLFYGESLPTALSYETLIFVVAATAAISLLSGIIPAIKASLLKPAAILKAE